MTLAKRPGFPFGLTLAALIAFATLVGLGVWQVHRLAWKEALLAHIAALSHAPPRPIALVLAAPARADFARVGVACRPGVTVSVTAYRYAVQDGRLAWRALAICRFPGGGVYDGIVLDRGVVTRLTAMTAPLAAAYAPPGAVVGVLRAPGAQPWLGPAMMQGGPGILAMRVADPQAIRQVGRALGLAHPVPFLLAVEHESPPLAGVTPAALPQDIPNNHLVYALTWFALAGILLWFYGAMLVTRYRSGAQG